MEKCAYCGGKNIKICDNLYKLIAINDDESAIPLIVRICKTCGHIELTHGNLISFSKVR